MGHEGAITIPCAFISGLHAKHARGRQKGLINIILLSQQNRGAFESASGYGAKPTQNTKPTSTGQNAHTPSRSSSSFSSRSSSSSCPPPAPAPPCLSSPLVIVAAYIVHTFVYRILYNLDPTKSRFPLPPPPANSLPRFPPHPLSVQSVSSTVVYIYNT